MKLRKAKEFRFNNEDDLLTENFETDFDNDLHAILEANFVGMVTILLAKFGETTALKDQDEDCFDVFPSQECYFLDEDSNDNVLFEKPDDVMKSHLQPLYIKSNIAGKLVN